MAFLVTFSWTCICSVASALARTIKDLMVQDRIADLEAGADKSEKQDHGLFAAVFSAEVLNTMRRTISTISRSIYRLKRGKTSEVEVEKADAFVAAAPCLSSAAAAALEPQLSHHHCIPEREVPMITNDKENATDLSSIYDTSLSISGILDLMPIPVTTTKERVLAASILAARTISPSPPDTPSILSPCTDSSHDSSFTPDQGVFTVLNTPLTVDEPMLSSPIQAMRSTPFLEQRSVFPGPRGHKIPANDGNGEYDNAISQETWTGFKFPRIIKLHDSWKKRNTIQFTPPFAVVEKDECEEAIESRLYPPNSQTCNSPWDDGINENHGLKGRAFWRQAMKLSGSADNRFWINNGAQAVAN